MKPTCVVSCPIDTFSGYGARSRDFVKALIKVKDKATNAILTTADYSELGLLLITVTILSLFVPILFVVFIQKTKLKTFE